MDINNFTSLPPVVLKELFDEPEKQIETLSMEDFLNLPLNDEYKAKHGNDPSTFKKYYADETRGEAPIVTPKEDVYEKGCIPSEK